MVENSKVQKAAGPEGRKVEDPEVRSPEVRRAEDPEV